VACTVFTLGCQLRCPFCHNASLVTHIDPAVGVDEEEVIAYLEKRRGLLDGVCVTGGEPLMQPELEVFLRRVKALGFAVKLDTNGGYPDRLRYLAGEGLIDYVAMDIKNSREKYPETTGVPSLDIAPVEESVAFFLGGTLPYEFRTTVVGGLHTVEDIESAARWIEGARAYYLQAFVDSGDLIGEGLYPLDESTLRRMCDVCVPFVSSCAIRGV
ncbi:MAG: anaerobic ribonucleoside-triphosphate reductase activating protein, partial [Clostridia bacterium]|nr:anaerobic ribonucleoside-triphosphate reductase activating protein [Clostridia bacterium]